jgi:hypothetical protein
MLLSELQTLITSPSTNRVLQFATWNSLHDYLELFYREKQI